MKIILGLVSHAVGQGTIAQGEFPHTEGNLTVTRGKEVLRMLRASEPQQSVIFPMQKESTARLACRRSS